MVRRFWRWLVGEPEVSERAVLLEALRAMREGQMAQASVFQAWLGMFASAGAQKPQGWTASDEALGIKESAQERGVVLPEEMTANGVSEFERVEWLAKAMEEDSAW